MFFLFLKWFLTVAFALSIPGCFVAIKTDIEKRIADPVTVAVARSVHVVVYVLALWYIWQVG